MQQTRSAKTTYPRPGLATSFVAPSNDLERKIAAIWGDMLGIDEIGILDNFFDLGGNSLLGIDLIARMRKELAVEQIPAHVLYEAPTVQALARFVDPAQQEPEPVQAETWQDRSSKRKERLQQLRRRG